MKHFKNIIMVQQPQKLVWRTIRDQISDLVPYLNDVASIETQQRNQDDYDNVQLVNLWRANVKIPKIAENIIDPAKLAWLDYANWIPEQHTCSWRIEPQFFTKLISCQGETRYEPAMGGRGTRITFEGDINIEAGELPGVPGFMQASAGSAVEGFVTNLIPKNFRKVTEALTSLLNAEVEQA